MISRAKAAILLGISTQVPVQNLFLTEGPSRTVRIGNQTVALKHVAPSKMIGAGTEAGVVIQAVRAPRQKGGPEISIHSLSKHLPPPLKKTLRPLIPTSPGCPHPPLNHTTALP